MAAAQFGIAARRVLRAMAPLGVVLVLATLPGCQSATPLEPMVRPAPRHPIQPSDWSFRSPATSLETPGRTGVDRLTPGPNGRVSPSPDLAPRVAPADRPAPSSTQRDIDELQRTLREQRMREREVPGPPAGTIDLRPGTIRTTPGTIEVPR